jgi:hypothetical protein
MSKKSINEKGKTLNNKINEKFQSMNKFEKIFTILIICCVGIFIAGLITSTVMPDANTGVTNIIDNQTDAQKNTTPEIYVTPDNASFGFFGTDTPAANSGYEMCINVNNECYYLGYTPEMNLVDYSHNVAAIYNASANAEYKNSQPAYEGKIGYIYPIEIHNTQNQGTGTIQFDFDNDKNFSFTYHEGTVGLNDHAKIVDSIFDDKGTML